MNEKIECLKLAWEYSKDWNAHNNKYKTVYGVVEIAKQFYDFVKDEQ